MYVFAIWSLNGLQWSNENQLQLVFIWSFGHLVRNFWVTFTKRFSITCALHSTEILGLATHCDVLPIDENVNISERDAVQDDLPRLRVSASLSPGGPQLPQVDN